MLQDLVVAAVNKALDTIEPRIKEHLQKVNRRYPAQYSRHGPGQSDEISFFNYYFFTLLFSPALLPEFFY